MQRHCETGSSCARKIAHGEPGTEAEFGGAIGRNLITTTSKARDEITEIRRGSGESGRVLFSMLEARLD
jgi:hypothetical protein